MNPAASPMKATGSNCRAAASNGVDLRINAWSALMASSSSRFPGIRRPGPTDGPRGRLELSGDDGMKLDDWFLVEHQGRSYLLSGTQYDAYLANDTVPKCALTLRDDER